MATDLRGHTVPANTGHPARSDLLNLGLSVRDPIPVANATAQGALIATLSAAGVTASTSNPIFTFRADAAPGFEQEYTVNGTTWTAYVTGNAAWTAPTLTGSWVNYGAPWQTARYKRLAGSVIVQGFVKNGGTGTGSPIFTLPVGFRPNATLPFIVVAAAGSANIYVDVNGRVYVSGYQGTGSNANLSLAGVTFPADV